MDGSEELAPQRPHTTRRGVLRGVIAIVQFVVVGIGGWWLFTNAATQGGMVDVTWDMDFIFAAVVANTLALCAMGLRLYAVAGSAGLHAKPSQFLRLHFQSVFYLFVLPLGVGMETARYIGFRHLFGEARRRDIVVAVLGDRGLGIFAAFLFAAVAWSIANHAATALIAIGGLSIAAAAVWLVARVLAFDRWRLQTAGVLSLCMQALTCAAVWLGCRGIGISLEPVLIVLAISASVFGALIPLALAGVQAGDFLAAGVLEVLGESTVTAVGVATVYYFTRLQGALVGACFEMARSSAGWFALLKGVGRAP